MAHSLNAMASRRRTPDPDRPTNNTGPARDQKAEATTASLPLDGAASSLVPRHVTEAGDRLAQNALAGIAVDRSFAADDPNLLPFLRPLAAGDEAQALHTLESLLRRNPNLLAHPYVWDVFGHLYGVFSRADPALPGRARRWLCILVKAWATSMTLGGVTVTLKDKPERSRGQSPQLFPHLDDRDGWLPTQQAHAEIRDAITFQRHHSDLKDALAGCINWRAVPGQYNRRINKVDYAGAEVVLREAASAIGPVFQSFKTHKNLDGKSIRDPELLEIVRTAFEDRIGGNPRHKLACGLLATLTWLTLEGQELRLTPSLVESTLETLAKHEIASAGRTPARSRPRRR